MVNFLCGVVYTSLEEDTEKQE